MARQPATLNLRLSPGAIALVRELWRRDLKHRLCRMSRYRTSQLTGEWAHRLATDNPAARDLSEMIFDLARQEIADDDRVRELAFAVPDGDAEYCLSDARTVFRDKAHRIGQAPEQELSLLAVPHPTQDDIDRVTAEWAARDAAEEAKADAAPPAADPPAKRTGKRGAS